MEGTCECGNEPSGYIKCGEFIDWQMTCCVLKLDSAPWSEYSTGLREGRPRNRGFILDRYKKSLL